MAKKKEESKLPDFLQELEEEYKYEKLWPSYYEELNFKNYKEFTIERNEVDWLANFIYDALEARVESVHKKEAYEIFKKMIDFLEWGDDSIKQNEEFAKEREAENKRREKLKKAQEAKEKAAAKKKAKAPTKK